MKYSLDIFFFFIVSVFLLSINACMPSVVDAKAKVLAMECGDGDLPKECVRSGWLTNDEGEDKGEYHDIIKLSYDVFRPCRIVFITQNILMQILCSL